MKLFIDWFGATSRELARAISQWLQVVVPGLDPWMSGSDTTRDGHRAPEVAQRLEAAEVAVVCLTPENLVEPWILYETGALAQRLGRNRVYLYLFDLVAVGAGGPLAEFTAFTATKQGTHSLVHALNEAVAETGGQAPDDERLGRLFRDRWADFQERILGIKSTAGPSPVTTMQAAGTAIPTTTTLLPDWVVEGDKGQRVLPPRHALERHFDSTAVSWVSDVTPDERQAEEDSGWQTEV